MNLPASLFMALVTLTVMVTIASMFGHVTNTAFYQIVGTIIATPILTFLFKEGTK